MKKNIAIIVLSAVLTTLIAFSLPAQNLLDNPDTRQSRQYREAARRALNTGDYDMALEYSALAEEYARKGEETARRLALMYRANTVKNRARDRIAYVRMIGAAERVADRYAEAQDLYRKAQEQFDAEEYVKSIEFSREVLALLEDIRPLRMTEEVKVLPRYYTVRLIPEARDCFWRIAEYEFVYGDPWKWPVLYEANKDVLDDPDNPHLIEPGQVFVIPSIDGEAREGHYRP